MIIIVPDGAFRYPRLESGGLHGQHLSPDQTGDGEAIIRITNRDLETASQTPGGVGRRGSEILREQFP